MGNQARDSGNGVAGVNGSCRTKPVGESSWRRSSGRRMWFTALADDRRTRGAMNRRCSSNVIYGSSSSISFWMKFTKRKEPTRLRDMRRGATGFLLSQGDRSHRNLDRRLCRTSPSLVVPALARILVQEGLAGPMPRLSMNAMAASRPGSPNVPADAAKTIACPRIEDHHQAGSSRYHAASVWQASDRQVRCFWV